MVDNKLGGTSDSIVSMIGVTQKSYSQLFEPASIQRMLFVYLLFLVGYALAFKLALPIFRTDTDMWYHLNGGRYLWAAGELPDSTFFSFIKPEKEWVNYFWGFQAVIYQIYKIFGYQGLVVFRALMYSTTIVLILAYIFSDQKSRVKPGIYIILTSLFVVVLASRTPGVRPHMFSYLFIALFLYILECRPKLAPLLPFAMFIWVNTHGVEWVVSALIAGSYFIEYIYAGLKQERRWHDLLDSYSMSIIACAFALVLNPYGLNVLVTSFAHDNDIYLFISELSQINPAILYSFVFSLAELSFSTAVTLFVGLEIVGLILLLWKKRLRVSHALLAAGGAFLLIKGNRFIWEWLFLSIPLVRAAIDEYVDLRGKGWKISVTRSLLVGYFAIIPFVSLASDLAKHSNYPFDSEHLPTKIVSFLNEHDAKGNMLAGAVDAGYLEWGLYPNILIYSDMQFPPFEAMQIYTINWSLRNPEAFRKFVQKYELDFIVVQNSATHFKEMVTDFPQFVPVFLDDMRILYANADTQYALTDEYAIRSVDPYDLSGVDISKQRLVEELQRLVQINPDDRRVNQALAMALFELERYSEALEYAEHFSELYPKDPNSHYWVGKILENMDRCDLAVMQYKKALKHSTGSFATTVQNHIGSCAYYQRDFDEAYKWFSQSMNPYTTMEDAPHMYQYAYATAIVGDVDNAIRILDMLLLTLDPKDESLKVKAERFREDLVESRLNEIGVVSWLKSIVE